jgi:hypothetical protein
MVAAVEQLMDKGEDRLSPEAALLETMAILIKAHGARHPRCHLYLRTGCWNI